MFTPEEKMQLFSRLPNLELSYEPRLHKKVYAPLYYIIPKGPKALVWYTYWGDQNVCLLVLLNERGNYSDIKIFPSVFSNQLALGTIIYGTYFQHQRQHFFTSEQLHYYKGAALKNNNNSDTLLDLFQNHIGQVAYTTTSLVVGMPVITTTYEEAEVQMNVLPYKTYGIGIYHMQAQKQAQHPIHKQTHAQQQAQQHPHAQQHKPKQAQTHQQQHQAQQTQLFKVKADLAADTYHLYAPTDNKLIGTALVSTYKTSVLLNSLFRHIKENANLDLLEESDDEDEFENTHLDKFVDLDKTVLMECVFSKRFQKWQPVAIKK